MKKKYTKPSVKEYVIPDLMEGPSDIKGLSVFNSDTGEKVEDDDIENQPQSGQWGGW